MEKSNFSFLFFLKVVFMLSSLLSSSYGFAQQTVDSTTYFYNKILNPDSADDLVISYVYFKKYKEEKSIDQDTLGLVFTHQMLAMAEYKLGQIYASEQSAIEALKLKENASNALQFPDGTESRINNHLGMVYRTTAQPEKAIQIYSKALSKNKSLKDSLILLNNLANAHRDSGNYDEAVDLLTSVVKRNKKLNNPVETARALDNLGYTQALANDPKGLENMLEALELRKELGSPGQLFTSYNHLAEYYKTKGDTTTARKYAALGKNASKKVSIGYRQEALESYFALSDDPEIVEYIRNNDSITKASLQNDIKFASIKYDFSKEQERTQVAQLERQKESQMKNLFKVIGLFILLLGIALYFILKYRHRKEKVEEIYRTESRISKKVHDEVANDLYQIMTKIQTSTQSNDTILDDLDSVYHKTRDISKDYGLIETEEEFGELLNDLLLNYQNDQVNVISKNLLRIDWNGLATEKKIALYRVLQELMTNMRKHSEASLVVLSAEKLGSKYVVEYTDNGTGGPIKMGNGLRNAENRIQSVNGTIIFETEGKNGLKVKIKL
ncbi:MAG TPA: hypothetical protein DEA82_13335 [Flavobacteriaceae bacterium]|nr:hypothetical protein [Flavobacteriaceae bacterium]HBR55103.1 hypothetical protein [Flavobacteriaceae bacterium]